MTPLHAVIGADGDPVAAGLEPSQRAEIRLFTAAVLRQIPEEPLQPVPLGPVWLATDADVGLALRMDGYTARRACRPASRSDLYAAGGLESPVYLDCDFLLGPEAAHLNITGVSGLATKTSAVEFLLGSIFQTFPAHKGSVAALCFNVKGPDLCFLDQPATLTEEDRRQYARLGLRPEPFGDVRYYAPFKSDGVNLNTLRTHEALAANTEPLVWGLREVLDYAEVVLNRDDVDAKADAFIDFLAERVVGGEYQDDMLRGKAVPGAELRRPRGVLPRDLRFHGGAGQGRRGVEDASPRHDPENPEPAEQHLDPLQGPRDRRWRGSRPALGRVHRPERVRGGRRRASIRWRRTSSSRASSPSCASISSGATSAWITWSCSWTSSISTPRPKARTPTCARCCSICPSAAAISASCCSRPSSSARRCSAESWATPGPPSSAGWTWMSSPPRRYATLSPATRIKLATLPKGELMVRHPHFTQPIFVRFPRPAVLGSREGIERFPPCAELPFADAVARQLRGLDRRVSPDAVRALVDGRREDDVRRALGATRRERPDDALAFFTACLGRRVNGEVVAPRRGIPAVKRSDDGYGF